MKRVKYILLIAAWLLVSVAVHAQKGQLKLGLNYNYSLPLGSFKSDLISNGSPRGFNGDIMYYITNKWSAGLALGYQDYYQKYPRAVYSSGKNEDISAVLSNSIQASPLMVKGKYAFSTGIIQPYISLAAGADMISYAQYLGEFGSSENSVSFIGQAGAGIMVPFGRLSASGFHIGASYDYVPYHKNGYSNLNNVNFSAGIFFPLR